ncbi:MAG: ABC transporter substrate-binding protein [Chloroflexi bacterium]|nr:ABC transporter substrate-binding protein [Chloroflexota bacterium]
MIGTLRCLMAALGVFLLVAACARAGPVTSGVTDAPKTGPPQVKSAGEEKWDSVLAAARKEGEVLVYGNVTAPTRDALMRGFKDKFGIGIDILVLLGAEGAPRIAREYRAGIQSADFLIAGTSTPLTFLKPENFAQPLEPLLTLPEVRDGKAWADGKPPFADKETITLGLMRGYVPGIMRNTDLVKEGEIASYKDLLRPQWKGKAAMYDPTVAGAGATGLMSLAALWGKQAALDYLRDLLANETTATRDYRLLMEWVARGKYHVSLWERYETIVEFLALGAPVAPVKLLEPGVYSASASGVAMPVRPAHPNAAIVFLNWLLSREGQTLYSRTVGMPSYRLDVPVPDSVPKVLLSPPGETPYASDTEESVLEKTKLTADAARMVSALTK